MVSKATAHKCLSMALLHIPSTPLKMTLILCHKQSLVLQSIKRKTGQHNQDLQITTVRKLTAKAIARDRMQVTHIFL